MNPKLDKKITEITRNESMSAEDIELASTMSQDFEADVLFQRIFNRWYAFSLVGEECLISEVSEKEVRKRRKFAKAAA